MRRVFSSLSVISVAVLCFLGGPSAAQTPVIPVDRGFSVDGIGFDQAFGAIVVAWAVRNIGGTPMLCGASVATKPQILRFRNKILNKGWLKADGKTVMRSLSHFRNAGIGDYKEMLPKARAACAPLPAGQTAKSYKVGFENMSIRP